MPLSVGCPRCPALVAETATGWACVEHGDVEPLWRPHEASYASTIAGLGVDPAQSVFVEDMARNLAPAKALGMTTVWLDNGSEQGHDADRSYVDHHITDLADWLYSLLGDDL